MAVIQPLVGKKGTTYRVLIRRAGIKPISKTFPKKKEAENWARKVESQMDQGESPPVVAKEALHLSFIGALEKYKDEITPKKLGADKEKSRIAFLQKNFPDAARPLHSFTREDFEKYRDLRLTEHKRAASTVRHDMNLCSNLYKVAREVWKIPIANPLDGMWKPGSWDNPRTERFESKKDQAKLFSAMWEIDNPATRYQKFVRTLQVAALQFALETAARMGEVLKLQWKRVYLKDGYITIYRPPSPGARFKGGSRDVPLSAKAVQILRGVPLDYKCMLTKPEPDARVFPIDYKTMMRMFRKARKLAGVSATLVPHIFRHERTSQLANKLTNPMDLAAVTGHKTLRTLQRYYHPTIGELRKKIR
jgi:integrase